MRWDAFLLFWQGTFAVVHRKANQAEDWHLWGFMRYTYERAATNNFLGDIKGVYLRDGK